MQKELVRRRGITEIMEKPELLEKIEPNLELVKTLLTHRDLLNPKTRILARKIIDQVVQELKRKMQVQVEQAITGAIRKDRHSPRKVFRNLDLKTTLRRNLQNFDASSGKLLVDQLFFYAAERKKKPWHVIVVVDQSGSMLESAIFSAVMASIFAELPAVKNVAPPLRHSDRRSVGQGRPARRRAPVDPTWRRHRHYAGPALR